MDKNIKDLMVSFTTLIQNYRKIQQSLIKKMQGLASKSSQANPGQFLLLQFQMSQITQVGESISNIIYQVNSVINKAVQNQQVR
jgi:succinate dehydrogenase/fumarate reductase-like Fe-S protein